MLYNSNNSISSYDSMPDVTSSGFLNNRCLYSVFNLFTNSKSSLFSILWTLAYIMSCFLPAAAMVSRAPQYGYQKMNLSAVESCPLYGGPSVSCYCLTSSSPSFCGSSTLRLNIAFYIITRCSRYFLPVDYQFNIILHNDHYSTN